MRIEEVKIYQLEELSKEAKNKAIDWYRDTINNDFQHEAEFITENFQYELDELNYPSDDVSWSLGYSQGDGMAFYGHIDNEMMQKIVERNKDSMSEKEYKLYRKIVENDYVILGDIGKNSFGWHYSHYNTMNVRLDGDVIENIIYDLFEIDYHSEMSDEDREKYYEKDEMISEVYDSIEEIISQEIKEISKRLERQGYDEIEYYTSDETIEETILANEYEFTSDGSRW